VTTALITGANEGLGFETRGASKPPATPFSLAPATPTAAPRLPRSWARGSSCWMSPTTLPSTPR
jgi:hypothetical protein